MPIRFLLSLLVLVLVAQYPALADEQWQALSATAMGTTGDVSFRPDRITFQNGAFLSLEPVETFTIIDRGESRAAVLYRVTTPDDPVLLQNNRLCGYRSNFDHVTFIAVWSRDKETSSNMPNRFLDTYRGGRANPQQGSESASVCSSYSYVNQ
jgi:hypothetical protein